MIQIQKIKKKIGQGPTNEDKEYMLNVVKGITRRIWNAKIIR